MLKIRLPRSLRARMMSFMGMLFLGMAVLIIASTTFFIYNTEQATLRARQQEAAQYASKQVEEYIGENENVLEWLDQYWFGERKENSKTLQAVFEDYPSFMEILFLDANGGVLLNATQEKSVLANQFTIPQSQWFLSAKAGENMYSDIQITSKDESYLIFSMPSKHGGVVAAQIKMDELWEKVSKIHFGESGTVFIIDEKGRVIAHTNSQIVLSHRSLSDSAQLQAILEAPNHEWYGNAENFNDVDVVSASTEIKDTGWIIITEISQREAFASSRKAATFIPILIFVLITIVILIFRNVLTQQILKPLDLLRQGASQIGLGNLTFRIEIPRKDEFGEVMAVFNEMANRLQEHDVQIAAQTKALQISEDHYRLLADNTNDVIWLRDMSLKTVYISPAVQKLRGYTVEEALAQNIMEILTPESAERAQQFFAEILMRIEKTSVEQIQTESRTLELEQKRKDGSTVWTETQMSFLLDEQGKPNSILGITRDISGRRRAAEKLRQINEELETRVEERTATLSQVNENLLIEVRERKTAEEQVRTSLQEKEVLLKEIHHRVKNNLQIISSLLNLQSDQIKDTGTLRVLRDSQARVRSMALIHEKLYQSKSLAKINFGEYVQSLSKDLFRSYQRTLGDIKLKVQVDEVSLDLDYAVPCGLILNELMTNALKYAFPNGRNGSILVELRAGPDQTLSLKVADDGVGLPQGLDILKNKSLGLQLINSLVKQIDGTLVVENSSGTAFQVSFKV